MNVSDIHGVNDLPDVGRDRDLLECVDAASLVEGYEHTPLLPLIHLAVYALIHTQYSFVFGKAIFCPACVRIDARTWSYECNQKKGAVDGGGK